MVRAGVARTRGQLVTARAAYHDAAGLAEAASRGLFAAVARRREGEIEGGDEGTAKVAAADAWLREQAIVRPDRFANIVAPGERAARRLGA
jgi:hypothetical protein